MPHSQQSCQFINHKSATIKHIRYSSLSPTAADFTINENLERKEGKRAAYDSETPYPPPLLSPLGHPAIPGFQIEIYIASCIHSFINFIIRIIIALYQGISGWFSLGVVWFLSSRCTSCNKAFSKAAFSRLRPITKRKQLKINDITFQYM